jgi:hypothetical protein
MDADAVVLMVVGMLIIWGGCIASIVYAIKVGRHKRDDAEI